MSIEDIFSYILFPVLFGGIAFLNYKIRINKRYDIFFNIDWESIGRLNSEKLLRSLTLTGLIFSLLSMVYFPILNFLEVNILIVILAYAGLSLVMAFVIYGFILKFQRGIP